MLEEIYKLKPEYPEISQELLNIRAAKFDKRYLGEFGGWNGIRKDMKKYYLNTGEVN